MKLAELKQKCKLKNLRYIDLPNGKRIQISNIISPVHIADYAKNLTATKRDCPIIISGYAGEGKSVLGIYIAKFFDRRYKHDRNLIYGREEFKTKVNELPPSALTLDENMNVLYKRDWGNKSQKEIIKLLDICRFKRHLLMFIQPTMSAVDSHVRDTRARLWIYVIKRGLGAVFRPLRQLSFDDPWRLKDNDTIIKYNIKKFGEFEGRIEGCSRCENFIGFIRFPDLDEEDYKEYEKVKDNKKEAYEDVKLFTPQEVKKEAEQKIFEVLAVLKSQKKLKTGIYEFVGAEMGLSNAGVASGIKKAMTKKGLSEAQQLKKKMEGEVEEYLT